MRSRASAWLKLTGSINYEEDIPAEQSSSSHEARFPRAHAHSFRPRSDQPSSRQGPQGSVRLIYGDRFITVERLTSHREFVAVLKHRRRVSDRNIVLHYVVHPDRGGNTAPQRRMGLAVSKAVGNAVTRNTVKRRFRVLAKRYEHELPEDCDLVMRAKPSAAHASFASLDAQVAALFSAVQRKSERQ